MTPELTPWTSGVRADASRDSALVAQISAGPRTRVANPVCGTKSNLGPILSTIGSLRDRRTLVCTLTGSESSWSIWSAASSCIVGIGGFSPSPATCAPGMERSRRDPRQERCADCSSSRPVGSGLAIVLSSVAAACAICHRMTSAPTFAT